MDWRCVCVKLWVSCTSVPFRFALWSSRMKCTFHRLLGRRLPSLSHSGGCVWRPVFCALLVLWWTRCATRLLGVQSSGARSLRAIAVRGFGKCCEGGW